MKRILIVILFCIGGTLFAQAQEKISYSEVIKVDSTKAENIFVTIKEWLSMEFEKGNNAVELQDKEAGLIVINASSSYKYSKGGLSYTWANGCVEYKINIQIRDNRFKVTITNFVHKGATGSDHLGVLTTAEEPDVKWGKKNYTNVWKDLKVQVEKMAQVWFLAFKTIDFKNFDKDTSEDDW